VRETQTKILLLSISMFLFEVHAATTNTISNSSVQKLNKKSNISYQLNFSSKAAGYSEGEDSASQVLFGVSPILKFQFGSSLYINADTTMNLSSSRTQSRYTSHSDNDFVLNELSMNYQPLEFAKLSVGSLNQSHLESPFLLSGVSFPGMAVRLEKKNNSLTIGLKAQSLIPTSNSFDSDRTSKEALPNLQTQGVYSEYKVSSRAKIGGQVNWYKFSDLPAVVAYESKRLGNNVSGLEVGDSNFENDFSGIAQSYFGNFKYTKNIEQRLALSIVENENTSSGSNRAQMIETSIIYKAKNDIDLIPGIGAFYSESDVAPAYYNSSLLGHNNRQGFKYSFRTVLNQMNLAVQLSYIDSKVINSSVYQDDLNSVELLMEMLNVRF